ncbi:MAG: type II secretion system F family protein [Lachnospiraceae bacterium]|nr:type II secretion system F family protein [Lachnospiraceae bacterium]
MAEWGYVAINPSGKEVKGSKTAESADQVSRDLKNQGLTVLEVKEQSVLNKEINFEIGGKPTPRDLGVFCRQFASITRAGVTIVQALQMLAEQTENKRMQRALLAVRADVEKGETFADSLALHMDVFPELLIQMARAGEASGSLEISMERMATQFERSSKTQALVKKAMIYPIVVAIVAVVVVIIMLVVVIPAYTDMFEQLDTELPGITLAVVAVSDFIQAYWFILAPVVAGIIFGIKVFSTTYTGKHLFGKLALKIPAIANLVTKSAAASMARTLSTLLSSGVPLIEAVDIVSETMTNIWFKEALKDAVQQIMVGTPLSQPVQACGLFPPMVHHMLRIGEEAGSTEEMLDRLADYYEEEVEMAVQSLMAAMEPMIIIVLAGIVGVLLGSVMAPMVTMYSALDNL